MEQDAIAADQPATSIAVKNRHKYIAVLGSCCTGDAVGATTFGAIATARLRLLLFQGRTSFLSMATAGLSPEEFDFTEEGKSAPRLDWGYRMAVDEALKKHQERVAESISLTDALVIDSVSSFVFPALIERHTRRCFIHSWEWEKFIAPRIELQSLPLWEIPAEHSLDAVRRVLGFFYERRPSLSVIFHVPQPCFNDGIKFEDPAIAKNVDFYRRFCSRVYETAIRSFPRVSAISPAGPRADPLHPSGPHPFRYEKSYLTSVRLEIERIMNV